MASHYNGIGNLRGVNALGGLSTLRYLDGWTSEWKFVMDKYGITYDRISDSYVYLNKKITNDEIISIEADKLPSHLEWINNVAIQQGNWIGLEHYMDEIIRYQLNKIRNYWNLWSIESEESYTSAELARQYEIWKAEEERKIEEHKRVEQLIAKPTSLITSIQADKVLNKTVSNAIDEINGITKQVNLTPIYIVGGLIILNKLLK